MRFGEIRSILKGIPYTRAERGKKLYEHILSTRPAECLELGFAHGVASCYIAAALHELGGGNLTCVDLHSSVDMRPNIEELLETAHLSEFVTIHREKNSYTWFLKKAIEQCSEKGHCTPRYDFCFIDGAKNWTIDGMAFFCVDKLLRQNGWLLFDDYRWRYRDRSVSVSDGIVIRDMSDDQIDTPNIALVFNLLVIQHAAYSKFIIDEDWAWAQKVAAPEKTVRIIASTSFRYRLLKKLRSLAGLTGRRDPK